MVQPIPVATYYRMSDDRQESSIDRQRSQVEPYCQAHCYTVVREYVDEGISGDEITKRKEFQRMLRDAQTGVFAGIVCDDHDRFGRSDSLDMAEIFAPLRRARVWTESVAQGRRDMESFGGRISQMALQEAKNQELGAISRRVVTGQLLRAQKGINNGHRAAYGYRWEADPLQGQKYVPDGLKAEVVKLIFSMYDQGCTLREIARELYKRGQPSPRGKLRWTAAVIQRVLGNPRYTGDMVWGEHAFGKHNRFGKGGVRAKERGEKANLNAPEDWVVTRDAHEALVDRETFARVQARLKGNAKKTTPHVGGGNFVLSKMLVCEHCHNFLIGQTHYGKRVYICGSYLQYGKAVCFRHWIEEKRMLRFLLRKLQQTFLDPANLQTLRAEMAARQTKHRSPNNVARLKGRIAELGDMIARGNHNLLIVPPDLVPGLVEAQRKLVREKETLQRELIGLETYSPVDDLEKDIAAAEGVLWRLDEAVKTEDHALLRQLLKEVVSKVELRWTHQELKKITRCQVEGGVVRLRPSAEVSELSPSAGQSHCSCCPRPVGRKDRPPAGSRRRPNSLARSGLPGKRPAPRRLRP